MVKGQQRHINYFNISSSASTVKLPMREPPEKADVPHFLGKSKNLPHIKSFWMQLYCLQLDSSCSRTLLTIVFCSFLLAVGTFLQPKLFCLQWESTSNKQLNGLQEEKLNCKHKSFPLFFWVGLGGWGANRRISPTKSLDDVLSPPLNRGFHGGRDS